MVNKSIIPHLKSSCIGLGLTEVDKSEPIFINGTGFFIDPDGYFVTADHVIDSMEKTRINYFNKNKIKLEYRGFWFENLDEKKGQLVAIKIEHGRSCHVDIPELSENIPKIQDLAMGKLSGKQKFPFLKFDKATKIDVFDEIFMCGYPGGNESLRAHDELYGHRMSPILQYGRIASLLPVDFSQQSFGIQTDILSTGGSSGSPIVDAETEQVLAVAQQVIPSIVTDFHKPEPNAIGSVALGLTWGVSNFYFSTAIQDILKILKSEFDEDGRPLSSEKIPDRVTVSDIFHPEKF